MFTEQPAPPPVAHIQPQAVVVAASPTASTAAAPAKVAAPETLPTPSPTPSPVPSPVPVAASEPTPEPSPLPSRSPEPVQPQASTEKNPTAVVQRRQEIEQALIEITTKARTAQKEAQQQQSATDAAKYSEAEEFERALEAANNPKLSASARAKLLSLIKAKQAQANKAIAAAKGGKLAKPAPGNKVGAGRISSPESAGSPGYSTQPILPMGQAELQLRLGNLLGKGNLSIAFPLTIPAPITSVFGWRVHPISGSSRFHRGIDLGAPFGSPVVAAKTGRVEAADFVDGYGLTVVVNHGMTQQTLYAHLSQVFVKPGDVVKQGQLIALVGSTGLSTGPHLHFEVHELSSDGWVALDPAAVLNQAIAVAQGSFQGALNPKGLNINLAVSGLLDVNGASSAIAPGFMGDTLLSSIFSTTTGNQATMRVPFTMLPPAIPELAWLISPFVDGLSIDQNALILPLLGFSETTPAMSLNVVPALQSLPKPVVFTPAKPDLMERSPVRLATTQPLANLTIAASVPGAIRPTLLQPGKPAATFSRNPAQLPNLSTLKLSDKRLKGLKISDRPGKGTQTGKES